MILSQECCSRLDEPVHKGLNRLVPVQTKRLLIRPFRIEDANALYELHRSPEVTRYAGGTKDQSESHQALQNLVRKVETTGFGALALQELEGKDVIGWCGIQPMRDFDEFEVTYALRADKWGKGLAYEAASAMLTKAFDELGLTRIYGLVFPQNKRSIRVLEKLGMNFIKQHFDATTQKDALLYSIGQAEFTPLPSSSSK